MTTEVQEPKIFIATGSTTTELAANVQTQVNTLCKAYRVPAQGQTSGTTVNDTIQIIPLPSVIANNVISYAAAVIWRAFAVPA